MTTEGQQAIRVDGNSHSLKELFLNIQEWWRYLLSKWVVIFISACLGAAFGCIYSYFSKPVYTATTTFVLEDEKASGGLGSLAGLASVAGIDLGGSGGGIFQGDNILGLYKSRTMLEKTLLTPITFMGKKQLLIDRYIDFNGLRKKWAEDDRLATMRFPADSLQDFDPLNPFRLRDSVLGVVVNDINKKYLVVTKPDKKLSSIRVDVTANDEVFAKEFNDALVTNVNDFYINSKTKKTLRNVRILQYKTDSVRSVMNGAIYSAVAVADATPNLNPTRQIQRVAPSQRAQFSLETNKSILSEMVKNLELTKMALLKETPLIQVVDKPIMPLKKTHLTKFKGAFNGAIIFGFLTLLGLIFRKIYINTMS